LLPSIVEGYGLAAGAVAADWYDDRRDQLGVKRRFQATPAQVKDPGTQALVGWALATSTTFEGFTGLVVGGATRRVYDAGRNTIMEVSVADPSAQGWQRETSGGCAFCEMLASRGEVYSEASADFASHDNCNCAAVPAFVGEPKPVKEYTPGARRDIGPDGKALPISEADRDRAKAWMSKNL
jgi:hypothetical protein